MFTCLFMVSFYSKFLGCLKYFQQMLLFDEILKQFDQKFHMLHLQPFIMKASTTHYYQVSVNSYC